MHVNDMIANLLATENLTVRRCNVPTASFNTKTRVLTLPIWKNMPPEVEEMLILHEIGHALFTTGEDWVKAIESFIDKREQYIFKGYINVVEDARSEKLTKRRYPGSRKSFHKGYTALHERDFFKLNGADLNTLSLIDRINMYFKCGGTLSIKFAPEELVFVNRTENVESMDDMIKLAHDLYAYAKARAEEQQIFGDDHEYGDGEGASSEDGEDEYDYTEDLDAERMENEDDEFDGDSEDSESTDEESFDEGDQDFDNDPQAEGDPLDQIESVTDRNMNKAFEELADPNTAYAVYETISGKEVGSDFNPVVDYKTIVEQTVMVDEFLKNPVAIKAFTNNHWHSDESYVRRYGQSLDNFKKFMTDSSRVVSYLVKEFEMRKSAESYKRIQTAKTGSLNMKKIHKHKISDDIFRRLTTVKEGKNHGMIFLLDWSGSMEAVMQPTIEQLINLTMFCRRVSIPFEVYAFTGSYYRKTNESDTCAKMVMKKRQHISMNPDSFFITENNEFKLLNIFSSRMSATDYMTMCRRMHTKITREYIEGYALGDTPFNEALLSMFDIIPEFQKRNKVEKLTFITLSDGAGGTLSLTGPNLIKAKSVKRFVKDKVTNMTYEFDQPYRSSYHTATVLKMIKDRFDTTNIGFYITKQTHRALREVIDYNTTREWTMYEINEMKKAFREDGYYSINSLGRDEMFIIPDNSSVQNADISSIDGQSSAAAIARKLTKAMNGQRYSRILLDKFIGRVA